MVKPPVRIPSSLSLYTDISGMMGIIESKCLWASNVSFLNDSSELRHALTVAESVIKRATAAADRKTWQPVLKRVVAELEDDKIPNTYVVCFCDGDDNLSQWRGYGGLDQGICVTFDQKSLVASLKKANARLQKVVYAKFSIKSKLESAIQSELDDLASLNALLGDSSDREKYQDVFDRVSRLLPRFKHIGFKDEREWRFVVQKAHIDSAVCFRARSNRIVPYIKIPVADGILPLASVRVGPGADQELTAQSLRLFLDARGYNEVEVEKSEVPFRA